MWKFKKEDGELIDIAYIDGYCFSNLLQDVMFKVTINSDNTFNVDPIDGWNSRYLIQFNKEYWHPIAVEYTSKTDIFCEMPNGGEDVVVYDVDNAIECPNC